MKKIKLKNVLIALVLFLSSFSQIDASTPLFDSHDILEINLPEPNKKIRGQSDLSFSFYDNDQSASTYTLKLFDPVSCGDTYYGQINTNENIASSIDKETVIKWNGLSTTEIPNLEDGKYCLSFCAKFKKESEEYNACSSRIIFIANNNSLPQIKSSPAQTTIKENDTFSYQIQVTDADNDKIKYRLVQSPEFLDINTETGLITSNNKSKLGTDVKSTVYKIMIGADDSISGEVYQRFDLKVESGTGTTNGNPSEIAIIEPVAGQILSGETNNIEVQFEDADGIKTVAIYYSTDKINWVEIVKTDNLPVDTNLKANFNVSNLLDGEYFLKASLIDNFDEVVERISETFVVQNTLNQGKPAIINFSPENLSVVSEARPVIKGELIKGDAEINIESFELKIDGNLVDNKNCEINQSSFTCILTTDLDEGRHNVEAKIADTQNKSGFATWVFDYSKAVPGEIIIFGRAFSSSTILMIILIGCLLAILLIVPWVLYSMWIRGRRKISIDSITATTNDSDVVIPELPATTVTTNYYHPEQDLQPSGWVIADEDLPKFEDLSSLPVAPVEPVMNAEERVNLPDESVKTYEAVAPVSEDVTVNVGAENVQPPQTDLTVNQTLPVAPATEEFAVPEYYLEPEPFKQPAELPTTNLIPQDITANTLPTEPQEAASSVVQEANLEPLAEVPSTNLPPVDVTVNTLPTEPQLDNNVTAETKIELPEQSVLEQYSFVPDAENSNLNNNQTDYFGEQMGQTLPVTPVEGQEEINSDNALGTSPKQDIDTASLNSFYDDYPELAGTITKMEDNSQDNSIT